jgi:hypothetical protein
LNFYISRKLPHLVSCRCGDPYTYYPGILVATPLPGECIPEYRLSPTLSYVFVPLTSLFNHDLVSSSIIVLYGFASPSSPFPFNHTALPSRHQTLGSLKIVPTPSPGKFIPEYRLFPTLSFIYVPFNSLLGIFFHMYRATFCFC